MRGRKTSGLDQEQTGTLMSFEICKTSTDGLNGLDRDQMGPNYVEVPMGQTRRICGAEFRRSIPASGGLCE